MAQARVQAGLLTCEVASGAVFIVSEPRDLHCVFQNANGQSEAYGGTIREVGFDFGVSGRGVIAWSVIAATTDLEPGVLSGQYGGAEAGGSLGVGGSARLLVGGSGRSIALQPLNVEARSGINIALGVVSMDLYPLFVAPAQPTGIPAPSVGHDTNAIPHAMRIPNYSCGSYTHLLENQTLSGVAHACGVTLEALLNANPNITNVRNISAGALINIPSHISHAGSSPCGTRTILDEGEALDHAAWRCGVTLHALLMANTGLRDLNDVRPGLVLAIPERSAARTEPPVIIARTREQAVSPAMAARPAIRQDRNAARQRRIDRNRELARLEIRCQQAAAGQFGVDERLIRIEEANQAGRNNYSVSLDVDGAHSICLINANGRVIHLADLSTGSGSSLTPPTRASRQQSSSDVSDTQLQACMEAITNETSEDDLSVLSSEFSEANSLVMVGVGPQRAPWRCLVANDGQVQEISFTGNDGDGVPEQQSSSDVSDTQLQACMEAITNETSEDDLSVLSSEFSEANSLVMVGVGPQRAPWRCLVANDGQVQEISFTGDEGKL